jgi:ABC-2 type transport system permease protein
MIFSKHPKNISSEKPILYLEDHQIDQEKIELKIIVHEIPKYISIDPFGTHSDKIELITLNG